MYYQLNVTYLSINFHFTKCTFSYLIELMRVKFMLVEQCFLFHYDENSLPVVEMMMMMMMMPALY